jgi:peptide/nickel transport system permease protein
MATEPDAADRARFETIDWDELEGGLAVSWRTWAFIASLVGIVVLFWYDYFVITGYEPTIGWWNTPHWDFTRLDWLFVPSMLVLLFYGLVPLAQDRGQTLRYWRRLRGNRLAVASLLYLLAFSFLGAFGPLLLGDPKIDLAVKFQPPLFFGVSGGNVAPNRVSGMSGPARAPWCTGSLQFPLGTDGSGKDLVNLIVSGMRVSLLVAVVTSMLIIPLATAVGTVAGYAGGWVDDILMRYVDVQQTVPAFVVYLILITISRRSLF